MYKKQKVKSFKYGWSVLFILLFLGLFIQGCLRGGYLYTTQVSQYVQLADDASTPEKKLEYLKEYKEKIEERVTKNDARFIFKRVRLTRDTQLGIIDTLCSRLEDLTKMESNTMQYQQGMLQITGQEFDHTIQSIDSIIHACYIRQHWITFFFGGSWLTSIQWCLE